MSYLRTMTYEEAVKKYGELDDFAPLEEGDIMQWSAPVGVIGTQLFSFDEGKHVYNVFGGGKNELTSAQEEIFRKENETMAELYIDNHTI